jgi:hypothetical protein
VFVCLFCFVCLFVRKGVTCSKDCCLFPPYLVYNKTILLSRAVRLIGTFKLNQQTFYGFLGVKGH